MPGDTRYRLGGRIVTLAAGVVPTRNLVTLARPTLVELASAVGEAAGLSVADGFAVHYVDQVDTTHQVQIRDWTGTRVPMHAVSSGQVFLAHMNEAGDRALPGVAAGRVHRPDDDGLRRRCGSGCGGSSSTATPGCTRSSPRA